MTQKYFDEFFDSKDLTNNLRNKSIQGGALTFAGQGIKFLIQFASTVIMARLITPEDLGLVSMVAAITNFIVLFKDMGLSMATIQRPHVSHDQVSGLFWVNVIFSLLVFGVMIVISPLISWFYQEQRLIRITIALSAGIFLGGLAVQHQAILRRQMKFKILIIIDLISVLLGFFLGVGSALLGARYWALIISQLASSFATLVGVWVACKWIPGLPKRNTDIRSMISYGKNLTLFNLLNYFARNLDNILIGKRWGADLLGLYSRAYSLMTLPITQISSPITAVATPVLSRLQDKPEQFRNYYLKAIKFIAYFSMPITAFSAVMSNDVINILLGSNWLMVAPIFRLLAFSAIVEPIRVTSGWLYTTLGRTDRMAKWAFLSVPIIILTFLGGLHWGPNGVAAGYSIIIILLLYPQFAYATKGTPVKTGDVFITISRPFFLALICSIIVLFSLAPLQGLSSFLRLVVCCSIEIAVFFVCLLISNKLREDIKGIIDITKTVFIRNSIS